MCENHIFTPENIHSWKIFTPEKDSPLKNIHPWKVFSPEKYSLLKNIHPLKIFTPEKYSPWRMSTLIKYSILKKIHPRKISTPEKYLPQKDIPVLISWIKYFNQEEHFVDHRSLHISNWIYRAIDKRCKKFSFEHSCSQNFWKEKLSLVTLLYQTTQVELELRKSHGNTIAIIKWHSRARSKDKFFRVWTPVWRE